MKPMLAEPITDLPTGERWVMFAPGQAAAYAAGFIDGEGHLGIARIRDRRATGQRGLRLHPRIVVANTDRRPLGFLRGLFGTGSIHKRGTPRSEAHREVWVWEVNGARGVLTVLRAVEPFLVCKAEEAVALRVFCERVAAWTNGKRLTAEEVEARNELSRALAAAQKGRRWSDGATINEEDA